MPRFAAVLVVLTVLACAGTGGVRRGSGTVLTLAEIRTSNGTTAHEVIEELRPQFLRSRGRTSLQNRTPTFAVVYVNDVLAGGLEALRSIRVGEIEEIRYINAADATTRYGTGHAGGVIQVRSNR